MEQVGSSQQIVAIGGDNNQANNNNNNNNNEVDEHEEGFGPIFVDGKYQAHAHYALEKRRFERDLTIQTMVDEYGQETCDFVEVSSAKAGTVTVLTYHPNPKAVITPELCWVDKPALYVRNAGRFYKEASNGKIIWHYKVLQGSIFELIEKHFSEDFMEGNYKNNDREKFCKKVAQFIQDYPHESARKYGVYLKIFKDMIRAMDDNMDDVSMESLMITISKSMTRVLEFNDKQLPEREAYHKLIDTSAMLVVKQCSSNVHYRLGLIDIEAQSAKNDLLELSARADRQREAERVEKQAKIDEMKARMAKFNKNKALPSAQAAPVTPSIAAKRKCEEITDANEEDAQSAKRQKTDNEKSVDQPTNDQDATE